MTKKNEAIKTENAAITEDTAITEVTTQVPEVQPTVAEMMEREIQLALDGITTFNEGWAALLKLAEGRVDESQLALDRASDAEIMRRLKLLWSKRVAVKKALENATLAGDEKLMTEKQSELDALADTEAEMNSYRTPTRAGRTTSGGVNKSDVDPSTLADDQLELGKLIRNLQSKKSIAKKAGDDKTVTEMEAKIAEAAKYRVAGAASPKTALTGQIAAALEVFQALPQTPEIVEQIKKLKALL